MNLRFWRKYLSDDMKTITLPAPFGTTYYKIVYNCCDVCCLDGFEELEKENKDWFKCGNDCVGNNVAISVSKNELNPSTLETFLRYYNEMVFLSRNEAYEKAKKITEERMKKLNEMGVVLDERGMAIEINIK